jgi:hypothetical protein
MSFHFNYLILMNAKTAILFLIALIVRCAALQGQTITFNADPNSSTLVNGKHPCLVIDSPAEGAVDTLQTWCSGSNCIHTVAIEMHIDSFDLGASTEGEFPCTASRERITPGCDTCFKGNGHHLYIVVDNGAALVVTSLGGTIYAPITDTTPGPHTIRAFMSRSWDESIKEVDSVGPARETSLYCVRTFYVDTNTGGAQPVDSVRPLLTPNSPLDTSAYVYPPDSVLLDFYMMFKDLDDGYRVEATIYDSTMSVLKRDTLTEWTPYCIGGLEEPPMGKLRKYFIRTRLLDTLGQAVTNGPSGGPDFNDRTWAFWVRRR